MYIKVFITILIMLFPIVGLTQSHKGGIVVNSYYTKNELVLSGRLLSYFLVAYNDFSKNQNDLSNFEVLILESDTEVRITFVPKSASDEKILGGKTSLGQSVSYYVSKNNNTITRQKYHR